MVDLMEQMVKPPQDTAGGLFNLTQEARVFLVHSSLSVHLCLFPACSPLFPQFSSLRSRLFGSTDQGLLNTESAVQPQE